MFLVDNLSPIGQLKPALDLGFEEETEGGGAAEETQTEETQKEETTEALDFRGELKDHPSLSKFTDSPTMAKSYVELEKLVGLDKIALPKAPKEGAKEEEIAAYNQQMDAVFTKLGRPEKADKYEINTEFPQEVGVTEEVLNRVKEVAHKEGLTNKQLSSLLNEYSGILKEQQESYQNWQKEYVESSVNSLKKEWGNAFDERLKVAQNAYKQLVDDEALQKELDAGLGNNPSMVKLFYKLGSVISNDSIAGISRPLTMTPEEAKRQIQEIKLDSKSAFNNESSAEHELAKQKMETLYKLAYPGISTQEDKSLKIS